MRSILLIPVVFASLSTPYTLRAQAPQAAGSAASSPQNPAQPAIQSLRIFILEGDKAVNSIPKRTVTVPVVEVRDRNELPVEGAEVVFDLPQTGPGGTFPGQQHTFRTETNLHGQARAPFLINDTPGPFKITVTAKAGDQVGYATISQTNIMVSEEEYLNKRPWYKSWKFWAVVGAGAAAATAVVLATRNGSGDSTPTITITPGGPVFGVQ